VRCQSSRSRMIGERMTRLTRTIVIAVAAISVALLAAACGTQHIGPPKDSPNFVTDQAAAQLFNQRCGGCHTLAEAGTQGSGADPRTYLDISGPNFNVRCERPAIRVLYAIENGGFSGVYMPQNVVTGKQAVEVANFVAQWAGRQAPVEPNQQQCTQKAIDPITSIPTPAESAQLFAKYSKKVAVHRTTTTGTTTVPNDTIAPSSTGTTASTTTPTSTSSSATRPSDKKSSSSSQ
jgi:mono/diheme cytochrome c family protein